MCYVHSKPWYLSFLIASAKWIRNVASAEKNPRFLLNAAFVQSIIIYTVYKQQMHFSRTGKNTPHKISWEWWKLSLLFLFIDPYNRCAIIDVFFAFFSSECKKTIVSWILGNVPLIDVGCVVCIFLILKLEFTLVFNVRPLSACTL